MRLCSSSRAEVGVAAGSVDVEVFGGGGVDGEVERHGQTEGVEAGAEVGGGCGQAQVKGLGLGWDRAAGGHAGWGWFMWDSSVRRTRLESASRTMGGLRRDAWRACVGRGERGLFGVGEEFVAVVVDGVLRVLQGVAGEDKHDALLRGDLAEGDELLEAGEGDGGGGFAADAFGADLGLGEGDLLLGDLLAPAAEVVDDGGGLAPGGGVADADGGGAGVGGDGLHDAVGVDEPAVERVGAFGLDDADLRHARDEAELMHLHEALCRARRSWRGCRRERRCAREPASPSARPSRRQASSGLRDDRG